jgi:hypothetical protein
VQFVFERRLSRLLGVCWFIAIASMTACTPAQISPADGGPGGTVGSGAGGSGAGGSAGTSGGLAGASGGGGGGSAGTTGAAGIGGGGGLAGTSGAAGLGGGGRAGTTGGGAGTLGGGGGIAPSGTAGSGGAGHGGTAGTTAAGGAAGTTGPGGSAGTTAGGGAAGSGGTTVAVTPAGAGQIVVTELMHDTDVVSDDLGEWFEIYNPSATATYDLFGCQIHDTANAHTINAHLLAPPHAFRTLAIFTTGGGFVPDYTYSGIKFDNDSADSVSIYCGSILIDKFAYSAAQAAMGGHSFSVDPAHYNSVDNDDPADFCLATTVYNQAVSANNVVSDYGTPGVTNPPCR